MTPGSAIAAPAHLPTVEIGGTGLRVARLGLGTVPLGNMMGQMEDEVAVTIVRRALELGLELIDTAPQYGSGLAERRVGAALQDHAPGTVVVATKVGRLLARSSTGGKVARIVKEAVRTRDPGLIWRNGVGVVRRLAGRDDAFPLGYPFESAEQALEPYFDFSYDAAMRSIEESLKRLGVDRIDILYIHDPDDHFAEALSGAYRALDELRSAGTIRAVGVGMNHSEPLARWVREADLDCVLLAGRYTLLDQSGMADLLPAAEERGVTVNVGGVFNSGILADPRPGASYNYEPIADTSPVLQRALSLQRVCGRHGIPLAAAAIQFPMAHPAVGVVLAGVRSVEELEANVDLFARPIPRGLWDDIRAEGLVGEDVPLPDEPSRA
jgi:D-threo-aldose 1-dehydrogenase